MTPEMRPRTREEIVDALLRRTPGFVPELSMPAVGQARAITQVFAHYMSMLDARLDDVTDRSLLAFLDTMGIHLLPAQAARAPIVFSLIDGSPADVTVRAGSQIAATPAPQASAPGQAPAKPSEPIVFATEQAITIARARLARLYSIVPGTDEFADHTSRAAAGFAFFDDLEPTEHAIYLGHDRLFALTGDMTVMLTLTLENGRSSAVECRPPAPSPQGGDEVTVRWEYLAESGWLPFDNQPEDDTTGGLRHDGQMKLRRACGPDAKQETFEGRTSYWIRGRLAKPLLPLEIERRPSVVIVNDIRASVGFGKDHVAPDAAFQDANALDLTKDFRPFGAQPSTDTVFYVASKDVFQRAGAHAVLEIALAQPGIPPAGVPLQTVWEYHDGSVWKPLNFQASPAVARFTAPGTISFDCPPHWAETTINGVKNRWLRARITAGHYGQPLRALLSRRIVGISLDRRTVTIDTNHGFVGSEIVVVANAAGGSRTRMTVDHSEDLDKLVFTTALPGTVNAVGGTIVNASGAPTLVPSDLQPPVLAALTLRYVYLTDPEALHHCLTHNDFVFEDQTEACRWPDQSFAPFRLVSDRQPAVYFAFDRPLPVGLVSTYIESAVDQTLDPGESASPFLWEYRSLRGWIELSVRDDTGGFRRRGMLQLVGPPDAVATPGLGGSLYRIRARLKQGERPRPLPIRGLWPNAVWVTHSEPFDREPLGSSDGNPGQTFNAQRTPVLDDEALEVEEWTGRGEYWRSFVQNVPDADLRFERDPANGDVTAVWVRWAGQTHLHESAADRRHYTIERARGLVVFGDGRHGLVPPAGARIALSYRSGGGLAGNVVAGAIAELRSSVPFVAGASNPVPASGGSPIEPIASVRVRGPQRLRNRDRAVAPGDWEWLAHDASSEVARARCLTVTGPDGRAQRGWVTVLVVPHGQEAQPQPSVELRRRVRDHLARRAPASVARRVRVDGARYVPVSVAAAIVLRPRQSAAAIEAGVRAALDRFLHPLTGGFRQQGWQFGETAHLSQIARVIERTEGVDVAREIGLSVTGRLFADEIPIEPDMLIAAGDHELKLMPGGD